MLLNKKTILLTGGNTGIGLEACKILCSEGHKVVATVRSEEKGSRCIEEVKKYFPAADIHYMICDVSNPTSVRQFVEQFRAKHLAEGNYLDILINNAGIAPPDKDERVMCEHNSNWEAAVATNCFGPVLLSDLLKDDLKAATKAKGSESMIVMLTCSVITYEKMIPYETRLDDIIMEKTYVSRGCMASKNSKVCLALASLGLSEELAGSNVAVHLVCPGIVPDTDLMRNISPDEKKGMKFFLRLLSCIFHPQSVASGGMHIVDVATHELAKSTTGKFWVRGKLTDLPAQCQDNSKWSQMLAICRKEINADAVEMD